MNPRLYFMSPFNKTPLGNGKRISQDSKAIEIRAQDCTPSLPEADSTLLVCCLQKPSNKGKQLEEATQATSFKGSSGN